MLDESRKNEGKRLTRVDSKHKASKGNHQSNEEDVSIHLEYMSLRKYDVCDELILSNTNN